MYVSDIDFIRMIFYVISVKYLNFGHTGDTTGSNKPQSRSPNFHNIFEQLGSYLATEAANVGFSVIHRLWFINVG